MKAVLDVNVVIAAVIAPKGPTRHVLTCWEARRFSLLVSEGIIAEVEEKLRSPKIGGAYGITEGDIAEVRTLLVTEAEIVVVKPEDVIPVTGDPEDDYVLATARLGGADYLVTGDKRLLALGSYEGTNLVTPRQFLDILGQNP